MNTLRAPKNSKEFEKYFYLRWQVLRKPWQQALYSEQDELESCSLHRMILDENEQVLAVGRLEASGAGEGRIRYMAVSDSAQGQGLGKQLLAALETQASQLGIKRIILSARESALNFYEKLGYAQQGFSHLLFNEIKHFTMTKKLSVHPEHNDEAAQLLEKIWHQTIPLSQAMNIQISYFDGQQLITHCDAEFNKNLHNTMFAGSIYTLATLTGWGWVYLALKQSLKAIDGDIVLAEANIRYHKPIQGLTYAKVLADNVTGQFDNLMIGKSARIQITAHVFSGENIAATFEGRYVVLPKKDIEQ